MLELVFRNPLPTITYPHIRSAPQFRILDVSVAEWLKHSPATQEVTPGSRTTFGGISKICFRVDTVYTTDGLKIVGVALLELTVTCNVSGDNW